VDREVREKAYSKGYKEGKERTERDLRAKWRGPS